MKDLMAAHKTVHPRLRGELKGTRCGYGFPSGSSPLTRGTRLKLCESRIPQRGSSPLTRGTQAEILEFVQRRRFIPAYAGNSSELTLIAISFTVHPRLRGELKSSSRYLERSSGSSPLTRGTLLPQPWPEREKAVHPRLRGELEFCRVAGECASGSSPLTRGTLGYQGGPGAFATGSSPLTRGTLIVANSAEIL